MARYGETRAGGIKWNGVLIQAERGTPVRAVYQRPRRLRRLAARAWGCC